MLFLTVPEIAAQVATELREFGRAGCCFVMAPVLKKTPTADRLAYLDRLSTELGLSQTGQLIRWFDTHSTAEALMVLEEIAAGVTPTGKEPGR